MFQFLIQVLSLLSVMVSAFSSSPVPPPPPISMPVWSLACPTLRARSSTTTSMNIMTFCTPVSISPKLWALALYHDTLTKESFLQHGSGILQLLTPSHKDLVTVLGKQSGYQVNKQEECRKVGILWNRMDEMHVLPECATYLEVKTQSTIEAGDHVVVICQVTRTGRWSNTNCQVEWLTIDHEGPPEPLDAPRVLYTGWLRKEGIL